MNFFSTSPRAKQAKTTSPTAAIAKRLETPEGCDAYLSELEKMKAGHAPNTPTALHLAGQIAQVSRAGARHRVQADRKAATAAIADSKNAAASAIKTTEKALAVADGEHARAVQSCAAMEDRMAPLSDRIEKLHQQAAQHVQDAQADFDAVMTQPNADEAAELKASQTLIEAQQGLVSSGAPWRMRLAKLSQQLEALKAAEQAAAQAQSEAVKALNQALCMQSLAEFDAASMAVLDAYFLATQARTRPGSEVPGWFFPKVPSPWFAQRAHVPGHRGNSWEGGGELSAYTVDGMSEALKPINLDILAAPLPEQIAEPAAVEGSAQ
jgi:hypothetical protein